MTALKIDNDPIAILQRDQPKQTKAMDGHDYEKSREKGNGNGRMKSGGKKRERAKETG